jgi:hypothetical protein
MGSRGREAQSTLWEMGFKVSIKKQEERAGYSSSE